MSALPFEIRDDDSRGPLLQPDLPEAERTGEPAALKVAELGYPVFPCRTADKRPLTAHGFKDATTDPGTIRAWWKRWPDALIGVPTGEATDLVVVDVDPDGAEWHSENAQRLAPGRTHRTRRGHHLLYIHPGEYVPGSAGKIAPGIDVRGDGGYIIWHPAHGRETVGDLSEIGPMPEWLRELITAPTGNSRRERREQRESSDPILRAASVIRDRADGGYDIVCPFDDEHTSEGGRGDCTYWPAHTGGYQTARIHCLHAHCAGRSMDEYRRALGLDAGDTADEDWPDLVALETAPPERLPVDQWPELLRDYATDAAAETETPIELPALLALGVVAASAQRIANVQVKRGHVEPINLYIAVAMPPATRKSREFKRATAPLVQWESRQREEIGKEMKAAESRIATHDELVKNRRKEAAKEQDDETAKRLATELAELEEKAPGMPRIPRVFTSDVTTENLATMMGANDESLAVMSSEGGIFETMAGRYSQGVPNIDLYLQGHAGDAVRVDRGNKSPVIMDDPKLSIALAVQPDVLDKMSTKPGFQGRGLLGRFLYAVPPSGLGERLGNGPQMNGFTEMEYESRITGLLEAGQAAEDPSLIHLSAEAQEVAQAFWKSVEQDLGHQGRFEHCPDWAGKLPGAVARIAALFHLARHGAGGVQSEVSVEDMKAAVDTGKALASHALAVYGAMGADPGIEDAKAILRWLRCHAWSEFTGREAHQQHRSRFPRVRDMDPALEVLTERGYIRERTPQRGTPGRPSREFAVNPLALW